MARLYANENFAVTVVDQLRNLGHDVTTVFESGMANQATPDTEVLRYAQSQHRALLINLQPQALLSAPSNLVRSRRHHRLHIRPRPRCSSTTNTWGSIWKRRNYRASAQNLPGRQPH